MESGVVGGCHPRPVAPPAFVRDIRIKLCGDVVGGVPLQLHSQHIGRDIRIYRHGVVVQLGECFVWPI